MVKFSHMKQFLIAFIVALIIGFGVYMLFSGSSTVVENEQTEQTTSTEETSTVTGETNDQTVTEEVDETKTIIGSSVEDRDITAYHYGTGDKEILFIGGIHAGYSWNTVLVAYELMDYLEENPEAIPESVKVTVIPALNPDGLYKVVGTEGRFDASDVPVSEALTIPGRFNANEVDLNRNFDCEWKAEGTWQNRTVDGGSKAFSEPESLAIRNYATQNEPEAVIVWYSAAGGVFSSSCHNGVSEATKNLTNLYANASGYKAYQEFNFYEITGDMVNWIASQDIPAISVLLTNHKDIEWTKNKAGIDAVLKQYGE